MSASYYAKIVAGFQAKAVPAVKSVTKYNEDTGVPYQKQITDYDNRAVALTGCNFTFTEEDSRLLMNERNVNGMGFFCDRDTFTGILGALVAKTDDINYSQSPIEFSAAIPEAVERFAKEHNLTPKLYLVPECSY